MRHTIEFDLENGLVIGTYHGPVRADEVIDMMREAISRPDWSPKFDRIIDYNDGMLGDLDPEAMREAQHTMGEIMRGTFEGNPTFSAQVCADPMKRPLIEYWMGMGVRDYPIEMKMFDTVAEAKAWIRAMRNAG